MEKKYKKGAKWKKKFEDFVHELGLEFTEQNISKSRLDIKDSTKYKSKAFVFLKGKKGFKNHYQQFVYPRIQLWYYLFDTKIQYNQSKEFILSRILTDGKLIFKKDVDAVHSPPVAAIFNDLEIVVAKTSCEHININWPKFVQKVNEKFSTYESIIVNIHCGGPVKWEFKN